MCLNVSFSERKLLWTNSKNAIIEGLSSSVLCRLFGTQDDVHVCHDAKLKLMFQAVKLLLSHFSFT
jgi:hypothetical protein